MTGTTIRAAGPVIWPTVTPARTFLRWLAPFTVLVAALAFAAVPPSAAYAEPDEGGNATKLLQNLEAAARGYLEAQDALEVSQAEQKRMQADLALVNRELGPLRKEVGLIAAAAYQNGRLNTIGALLASTSTDDFLTRATMLEEMTVRQDEALHRLTSLEKRATAAKAAIDTEVAVQQRQSKEMRQRIDASQLALSKVGGHNTSGWLDPDSPIAKAALRTSSGGWPKEYCSVKDPTDTNGCITPRTLNAFNEARKAGFTRFTKCWRTQSWGEHPKGRACDFSAEAGGFGGAAAGGDKTYGNRLAAFFIANARNLGVLYVIWYKKIWMPGIGWRTYSGCCGASAEHLNHVHLSMY